MGLLNKLIKPKKRKKIILSPRLKGISNGEKAFIGPKIAQIDITNNCNLDCVGCWCHSDLMEELKFVGDKKKQHLTLETIKELLDNLSELGTEEIQLSGSGDPSMHPNFIEVLRYIKSKGFKLQIITNFTLFTKKKIQELVELQIDKLTISFWAGTVDTYLKTHPNQTAKSYINIKDNLIYLHNIKKSTNKPSVKIYNVISSLNYFEIEEMIDFALDTMVDFIEFQTVDVVEGKSDSISLTEKHKESIRKQFYKISKRNDLLETPSNKKLSFFDENNHKKEFVEFNRFVKKKSLSPDFQYFLEDIKSYAAKCQIYKWHSSVEEDHSKENSLKFLFDKNFCIKCSNHDSCSIDKKRYLVKAEYLSLLGSGTFFRRVSNITNEKTQVYDMNIVDTMPCYIGWTYTRVLPNGDVIPCCKAHKKPLGNLYSNKFKDIWYSAKYNKFRLMAKTQKKNNVYFMPINCYKSCDNVGMNLEAHLHVKKIRKR